MLNKDPEKRATIEELISDPWLTRFNKHPIDIYTPGDTDSEEENNNSSGHESEDESLIDTQINKLLIPSKIINRQATLGSLINIPDHNFGYGKILHRKLSRGISSDSQCLN